MKKGLFIPYVEDTTCIDMCVARQIACAILQDTKLTGSKYYKEEDRITNIINNIANKEEHAND